MDYKGLIRQMESLKRNSKSFITEDSDPIWQADVDALDEAMDIIADYEKVTEQLSQMIQKYEVEKDPIDRGMGVYQCPDCSCMVNLGHEHCRRCGRRLGWMPKPKARSAGKTAKKGSKGKSKRY